MPKLRGLSGKEVVSILRQFGFTEVSQRGSHIKLKRFVEGRVETLTVPAHTTLDPGTLRAIIRQAARFISEQELRPYFYQ